jgi:hypothetical protein
MAIPTRFGPLFDESGSSCPDPGAQADPGAASRLSRRMVHPRFSEFNWNPALQEGFVLRS